MKVFDAHADTLSATEKLDIHTATDTELTRIYAIWGGAEATYESRYLPLLKRWREAKFNDTSAMLSVEGAHVLDCSLERLRDAAADGVCAVTLTWNNANSVSGSCADNYDCGLTRFGRTFVRECERLNVTVDAAHLSERGFYDVAEMCAKPFAVTHANSAAVCPHRRNLSDDQFRTLIQTGGAAGITFHQDFAGGAEIDLLIRHIMHWLDFDGGENAIGIGTDFDGGITPVRGLEDDSGFIRLIDELLLRGVSAETANKIMYGNWARIFKT
jgi:membrane dipeptidase